MWDLVMTKSYGGWEFSLRPLNIRPNDSLVFDYATNGNVSGLLKMFSSGEASPFDHDEAGRSLLHVSTP